MSWLLQLQYKHVHLHRLCCSSLAVSWIKGPVPWKSSCRCQSNSLPIQMLCLTTGLSVKRISFVMIARQYFCSVTTGTHGGLSAMSRFRRAEPLRFFTSRHSSVPLCKAACYRKGPPVIVTLSRQSSSTGCSWWISKEGEAFRNSGSCWATSPSRTAGRQSPLRGCRWGCFMFERSQSCVQFWHYAGQRTQKTENCKVERKQHASICSWNLLKESLVFL